MARECKGKVSSAASCEMLGKIAKGAGRALSIKMRTSAFMGTLHGGGYSGGSAVLAGGSGEKWSVATYVFFISACLRHAVFRLP